MKAGVKFIHAAYGFGTIREKVPEIHKFEDLVEAVDKVFEGLENIWESKNNRVRRLSR